MHKGATVNLQSFGASPEPSAEGAAWRLHLSDKGALKKHEKKRILFWCYRFKIENFRKFENFWFSSGNTGNNVTIYRAGPLMIAINFQKWDHIWLQSKLRRGPNMIATLDTKGTKYDCNFSSWTDHIWLQFFSKRTKYDCNHRKFVFMKFVQKS